MFVGSARRCCSASPCRASKATVSRIPRPTRARRRSPPNGRAIRCPNSRPSPPSFRSATIRWAALEREAEWQVEAARAEAESRGVSPPERVTTNVFYDGEPSEVGGGAGLPAGGTSEPKSEGQRIDMVTAIRRVIDQELAANPKMLVFGEDVGPKGGVHAVTLGLQDKYGVTRVFDLPQRGRNRRARGRDGARRAASRP